MSHSLSGSLSVPGHQRPRSNSQSKIVSAISAIQQRENADASGVFIPGTGGFIGGPPTTDAGDHGGAITTSTRTTRGASVRHRKDHTQHILNGHRVRTTDRICSEVGEVHNIAFQTSHLLLVGPGSTPSVLPPHRASVLVVCRPQQPASLVAFPQSSFSL